MALSAVFVIGVGVLAFYGIVRLIRGGSGCGDCASCSVRSGCGSSDQPQQPEQ
jgi:hypothetical protein